MQPGDYRKLTNGSPIQPYSTSYANAAESIVCSLIGNQLVANSLPSGTNQIIGCVQDKKSNRLFFAGWNNTAANNSIYQYSGATGAITLVMRTALFAWAQTDFVDMDIVGDILIFTNNGIDIQKINVLKAIAGGTYTPLAVELTFIKPPPLAPLTWALGYDTSTSINFISGSYFQFFYRYVYEDYDYSVFNSASLVCNGWLHPTGIDVDYASHVNQAVTGNYAVDGEVTPTVGDRILLTNQTNIGENGIWVKATGAWTKATDSPDISSTPTTVYVKGGVKNFSQVWFLNVPIGGTVVRTNLTGPNYMTITRPVTPPATVIQIEYAVRVNGSNEFFVYKIEKTGAFTSSHTFYNTSYLFTVPDADTFVWNDNIPLKTKSLKIFKNRTFLFNNTEGYTHNTTTQVTLSLTNVTPNFVNGESVTKVIRVAKGGGRYNVGVMFFDFAGRHSGVKCDNTITIPESNNKYKIHVDLTAIAADIPTWAVRRSIVCTKELTSSFFLSQFTQDIYFYKQDGSGVYTYNKDLSAIAAEGTAIDISALTKEKRGYTFNAGDRIKIYDYLNLDNTYHVIDVEILAQDGRFVFTRVLSELNPLSTTLSTNFRFQIYTPIKATQAPFFETGITNINGTTFDLDGDIEIGIHEIYSCPPTGGGSYSATDPFAASNAYIVQPNSSFLQPLEDMSVWEKVFPQWITDAGRSLVKSDSRQINKYTYLRFGQQFILNANFLGLNTFYALDEQALPIENGAGTRLAEAGEVLVAVQEVETEAVYVGQGFVQTSNANLFLTKTDNVIGDARKYLGGHGSLHPASVVAREGKVYYLDIRKGVVVRRAQDGLYVISDYGVKGLISTLCNTHATLATSRIIAGWDPQYDCYCISFIDTSGPSGITLYFHEKSNSWIFQSSMLPEFFGVLNQNQFAFLNGGCWIQSIEGNYNKFFGVQYNRQLDMEFSPLRTLIHIWDGVEVDVENIYVTSGSNEVIIQLYHKNGDTLQTQINYSDFILRESDRVWRSAFFRWMQDQNFTGPNALIQSKYNSARRVRGQSAFMTVVYNGTDRNPMKSITVYYTPSMQSNP